MDQTKEGALPPLLHQAEPWFQMGQQYEDGGDSVKAAHCYYLANEMGRHGPSLEALRRLGYLDLD